MAYQVVYSPYGEPIDYSVTKWQALGNGMWSNDPATYNKASGYIPKGYHLDTISGGLVKDVVDDTLDTTTIDNVNKAKDVATSAKDGQVVKFLEMVLNYGTKFISVAKDIKVLINGNEPISYSNIDKDQLAAAFKAGKLSVGTGLSNSDFSADVPNTSTYFGIDFSKPLNWVLVILALWAIYQIINLASTPKPQPTPVQSVNQGYQGRARRYR